MSYFVTGATGFIGRNLVERLLQREGTIYALVRAGSRGRLEELRTGWGADGARVVPVAGDLTQPGLGISEEDLVAMRGEVDHFFHLAAIYDITADAEAQEIANVEGTRHAVELAGAIEAGCFHQVSSIAAAGLYRGEWREDMFDEAERLDTNPYFRTKHESERLVREDARVPGASTGRGSSSATRAPARSTRSTAPTTSSRRCSGRAGCCPPGCRRSGSKAARSTSSRSTTSPRRSTTSPTSRASTAAPSTSPTPTRRPRARSINLFAKAADAPQMTVRLDTDVTEPATGAGAHGAEVPPAGQAGG